MDCAAPILAQVGEEGEGRCHASSKRAANSLRAMKQCKECFLFDLVGRRRKGSNHLFVVQILL